MKPRIIGIIPARMASSRFPGKPLAPIHGIPMIGHVYFRSKLCAALEEVYMATCDKEIERYAQSIGAPCIMTSDRHERASDRVEEALLKIEKNRGKRPHIVVMIQGDEPMLTPSMIQESIRPFSRDRSVQVVNLMAELPASDHPEDPNEVKVTVDQDFNALYFSREAIPSSKKYSGAITTYKQVCIIPFRRDFLLKFSRLRSMPLEKIESIEMLRVLEHGLKVKMVLTQQKTFSVDTPGDLRYVASAMKRDPLRRRYEAKARLGFNG